jgi:hypothetical protein
MDGPSRLVLHRYGWLNGFRHEPVLAARNIEPCGRVLARTGINIVELAAQLVHINPNDGVAGGVKVRVTTKHLGADFGLFGRTLIERAPGEIVEESMDEI